MGSVGVTRDCVCPIARHVHGTRGAYRADRCRCGACVVAHARLVKRKAVLAARTGRWTTRRPPQSAVGVARRLQALAVVGWSSADLAPLIGSAATNIVQWRLGRCGFVQPETYDRVVRVYDEVWDRPAPGRHVVKVRNVALRHGWLPPMVWDDATIDDPAAAPVGVAV